MDTRRRQSRSSVEDFSFLRAYKIITAAPVTLTHDIKRLKNSSLNKEIINDKLQRIEEPNLTNQKPSIHQCVSPVVERNEIYEGIAINQFHPKQPMPKINPKKNFPDAFLIRELP